MLATLLAMLLLAAAPTATASPAATLHEIGQQHAIAGVCGPLVVHANAAIDAALHDDQWLAQTIARLRSLDLEGTLSTRRAGLTDLARLSGDLHETALHGEDELHRLADAGERHADTTHRQEVREFSDALYGAFARETRVAIDLSAFLSYLDYIDFREISPSGEGTPPAGYPPPIGPGPPLPRLDNVQPASSLSSPYSQAGSPNRMARAAAGDFESRVSGIAADEAHAAAHSEAAVTGCGAG